MCGINGIYRMNRDQPVHEDELVKMRDSLIHRGPDGAGLFVEGRIGLGHRRLSIIDLSDAGKQPMKSASGRLTIVFNGEIYNYRELREELERRGISFRTESDTEILLELYEIEGISLLNKLNGIFAFAIWDKKEQTLNIVRDRLGVKPLYYCILNNTLYFASEPKAFFTLGLPLVIDESKLPELMLFRYAAGPDTLFKGVKKLLPGHFLTIKDDQLHSECWWSQEMNIEKPVIKDYKNWFRETFDSSIRYRMVSDVPVGVLLSGGLDSSSVVASIALQNYTGVSTFNVGFEESEYDESPLAKQVSEKYHLDFHSIKVNGPDLFDALEKSTYFHDEPLMHSNDPQLYAISKYAKKYVTVLQSGEGADEFMGGYVRYRVLENSKFFSAVKNFSGLFAKLYPTERMQKLHRYLKAGTRRQWVLYNACNFYPGDVFFKNYKFDESWFEFRNEIMDKAEKMFPDNPMRQGMYLDQNTFLQSLLDRNDRTTMGASIECREPFLDFRIVEGLNAIPNCELVKGKTGKKLLIDAIGNRLPEEILNFKKWGFGVPWKRYFEKEEQFRSFISEIKTSAVLDNSFFQVIGLKQTVMNFEKNQPYQELLLRQAVLIYAWEKFYLNRF